MDTACSDQHYLNQIKSNKRIEQHAIDIAGNIRMSSSSPACAQAAKHVEDALEFKAETLRQQAIALSVIYHHIRECGGQKTDSACAMVKQEMQNRKKLCIETALQMCMLPPGSLEKCNRTRDSVPDSNILVALQALNNG
jgi:hypothetical protein